MKYALLFVCVCACGSSPAVVTDGGTDDGAIVDAASGSDSSASDGGLVDGADASGSPQTGASQASCSGTCSPGTVPTNTVNVVCGANGSSGCSGAIVAPSLMVDNGTGTIENRSYGFYIPSGLKHDGSADGMPAAVFDYSRTGCGTGAANGEYMSSQIGPVADANRFIVIELECLSGTTNPLHPETDCGTTCSAAKSPSDNPYIRAAVLDATTRFSIDPARRYLVGGSSAANMARDAICSTSTTPHNSSLFRGIMTMGGGAQALTASKSGVCPSGDKSSFWLMLMGKASPADPYLTMTVGNHSVLGFDDTRGWWASYLGSCQAPNHTTTNGTSDVYDYSGCTNTANASSPFFEAVAVTNGGHMWCGLDAVTAGAPYCTSATNNTNGFSTAQYMWKYFASTTVQ